MVSLGKDVAEKAVSEKTPKKDDSGSEIHVPQQNPNNGVSSLQSDQKGGPESIIPEKASQVCDSPVPALQSNQEGSVSSLTAEKVSQTPETTAFGLQSVLERSTSSRVREKGLEDGYNWRKYGQKLVRGNLYVRSYYRCTHPKCPVKRQVERTHDGQVTDTVYFGQHEHPEPQLSVPVAVGFALSIVEAEEPLPCVEDKSSDAHGNTSKHIEPVGPVQLSNVAHTEDVQGALSKSKKTKDGEPDPKRQKKEKHNGKSIPIDKRTGEPRLVVQTMSEVDIVNDGYRWRKYGQKMVKGNPNPRSYYRCSHPGCPVKKHVERAFNDSKVVIATYEGQHDHDVPPARTVIHNAAAPNVLMISQNGESGTKSEKDVGCRSIVACTSPKHEDMVVNSDMGPERKLDEKLIGKASAKAEEGGTPGMIVCRADKLQNGESESKSLEPEKPKTKAEPIQG